MIEHGVTVRQTYGLKRVDEDYFRHQHQLTGAPSEIGPSTLERQPSQTAAATATHERRCAGPEASLRTAPTQRYHATMATHYDRPPHGRPWVLHKWI